MDAASIQIRQPLRFCSPALQSADAAIADFFTSIGNIIAGQFQVLTGQKEPQVSIAPPSFFNNGAANISTSLAGVSGTVSPLPPCRHT